MTAQTILPANTLSSGGYDVANSVRFNGGDSAYMNITSVSTVTNRLKFTISLWVKRSTLGAKSMIGTVGGDDTNFGAIWFDSSDRLNCTEGSGGGELNFITNRLFRDVSAWYHIVLAIDTTQGTEANRVKIYVNGVQETSFSTSTYPSQNSNMHLNRNGKVQYLGRHTNSSNDYYFDGYMAEVVWIDGSQEAPTSFGEFDSDSPTIWKPIDPSGLTFGNNGFYLDFEASGNLGNDANGGTDWTENNLAATDQSTDSCTNNFATMNPLYKNTVVLSEGNLLAVEDSSEFDSVLSTIAVSSGKWYVEFKVIALAGSIMRNYFGICDVRDEIPFSIGSIGADESGRVGDTVAIEKAAVNKNGSSEYSITNNAANDIFGVSVDLDNGAVYFSKNGSLLNSGDPTSGASKTGAVAITTGQTYLFGMTAYDSSCSANFGNPHVALSSANADANGYGSFEYAVPSGYYSLNTKNLAEFG